ncbi:NAD(P)-dependent oxidoreductase, partial [Hyphomonas oceanitis]
FDDLLTTADIISLHVPSTPRTRHLVSADAFKRMKDGVVIINTARGDVIDTQELIKALKSGKVSAAGLDVLPDEPMLREEAELICSVDCDGHDLRTLVADQVLLRMPNVIVTPHSAFNTQEAIARIAETTLENIKTYLKGVPQNLVATQQNLSPKEQEHA